MNNKDLFDILLEIDDTWAITKEDESGVILSNASGSTIHGVTLNAALLTVLMIYQNASVAE